MDRGIGSLIKQVVQHVPLFLPTTTLFVMQKEFTSSSLLFIFTHTPFKTISDTQTPVSHIRHPYALNRPGPVPCLDFMGPTYAAVRQVMSNNGQVTNKQAA